MCDAEAMGIDTVCFLPRAQEPRQSDAVAVVRARVVGGTEYRGTFVPGFCSALRAHGQRVPSPQRVDRPD